MAIHPDFPSSPYEALLPEHRWFPAAEELRDTAYEKLLPPLVANIRNEIRAWREQAYTGASATSRALLEWWFNNDHLAIANLKEGKSEVLCDHGSLVKVSKNKEGVVTREVLTGHWTDWVDYWAVDFDYESRKEIIKVPKGAGIDGSLPGFEAPQGELALPEFEEQWTGAYIFENEWQSFRTRQNRELELITAEHTYERPGRYTVAVKVIDIFGNDTMTLVPVTVG